MPTGAAGGNVNLGQVAELGLADLHLVEEDLAGIERNPPQGGVADGARLLVDFLEHEMLEAALLRHDGVPGDVLHLARDGLAVEVGELHARGRDHGQVAVGQEEQVARVIEDRRHVGGDEVLVLAQADDRRRAIARGHDLVGLIHGNHRQREDARQLLHRPADGFFQRYRPAVAGGEVMLLDQVGDDLGVGLGGELVPFFDEPLLEREVVLDNAVVHHHDLAGAIAVRVGVFLGGTPVRGPAGVADAVGAVQRLEADGLLQVAQLAFGAADLQPVAIARHGDAGGVIAAVFQPLQPVQDDGHNPLLTNVSDNATHVRSPLAGKLLPPGPGGNGVGVSLDYLPSHYKCR